MIAQPGEKSACCSGCAPPNPNTNPQQSSSVPMWENASVLACGALALCGWLASHFSLPAARAIYAVAIAAGIWPLLRGSLAALRSRSLDMNILMSVAVAGACVLGDWGEAASLVFLYAAAEWIEEWSVGRSRRAIGGLMTLAPPRALVRRDNQWLDVDADEVAVGEIFLVRAGERLALDGTIESGASELNQAPVTGESTPVYKASGDEVFAGTLNGGGAFEVRATRPAREGTVARIARLVEEAESQRSPRQRLVEKFARRYTPVVMLIATAVALVPPLALGAAWNDSVLRALALLVAACPCAFVLGGPVATICALSAAARGGVLIRGGGALENLAELRVVAFDKTGTLSLGAPRVTDFTVLNGMPPHRALEIAAALERRSDHPLARAVVKYVGESRVEAQSVEAQSVEEDSGHGVRGIVDGANYRLGRVAIFAREGILNGRAERVIENLQGGGRSVALLCSDNAPLAAIGFADEVRGEAQSALANLKKLGIEKCVILSGDHAAVVQNVARDVGADEWHAGLLPHEKLKIIRDLAQAGATGKGEAKGATAMVGDGINDAPALAAADIGVAMGAAGSDAALEVAHVALMGDDLQKLPFAVALSRRARSVMRQNIALALAMKLVFAVGLFLNFWGNYALIGGVIADVGATLLVTANGLRLLQKSTP